MNINFDEVVAVLKGMPEVTKAKAMASLMLITDGVEAGEPDMIESVCEIAGMAATCDNPEMIRRFIVMVQQDGPILKH